MYQWDFSVVFANAGLLAEGLARTLEVTAVSLVCGLLLGLTLALLRLSPRRLLSWPAGLVIEVFRTTPPLVQLFWFFFALPLIAGIELTPFAAAVVTFSIQSAAFFAEVFRAGIQSIDRGQWEGALAIGMSRRQALFRIVLPQAVTRMIPAFMERSIELMKTTTLVATIAYADLLYQANAIAQKTFRPLETFTVAALIYFVVIFAFSLLARRLERRLAVGGEFDGALSARMGQTWDFASVFANSDALIAGAAGTLRLFAICLVLGLGLGLVVGLGRYARSRWFNLPATVFVEFFRNTPVLVQMLWFYFALPILVPFEISPLAAAALGISLNTAAFSAEIYRGGIQSIERGQWDGARAIGMGWGQAMRRIILPQAIKRMTPALTNRAIEVFKMTTLASTVAYVELLQQGKLIASLNFNPIEVYTTIAVIFFIILWPLVQLTYALERRLKRGE